MNKKAFRRVVLSVLSQSHLGTGIEINSYIRQAAPDKNAFGVNLAGWPPRISG